MPAIAPNDLIRAIDSAIYESGYSGHLASPARQHPRRYVIASGNGPVSLNIYAWTLTFGGRPSLANEYRIQMTSVKSPLERTPNGITILVGYEPAHNLFAGFDLDRHSTFTAGSPSVQIDVTVLQEAERNGLSFHRKSNDEVAIGIRPDMFVAYAMNASVLHRYGREAQLFRLLSQAAHGSVPPRQISDLTRERQRVVTEVSRLTREAAFRQRVMFAYGNRCAVTRMQMRLVDAAHILPVGASGSTDAVHNGIALSPTYHRAFDAGLIYLDEDFRMCLDEAKAGIFRKLNLAGGLDLFSRPLGQIFLPPDPAQHPSVDLIRRANCFRQIAS